MVPLVFPKLGNVLLPIVRESRFLVYVLRATETECHQSVTRADGEILDYQGFLEAFWGRLTSIGFC